MMTVLITAGGSIATLLQGNNNGDKTDNCENTADCKAPNKAQDDTEAEVKNMNTVLSYQGLTKSWWDDSILNNYKKYNLKKIAEKLNLPERDVFGMYAATIWKVATLSNKIKLPSNQIESIAKSFDEKAQNIEIYKKPAYEKPLHQLTKDVLIDNIKQVANFDYDKAVREISNDSTRLIQAHINPLTAAPNSYDPNEMFVKAFEFIIYVEGEWSNDPNDNGGKTKFGITEATLNDWNKYNPNNKIDKNIKDISMKDAEKIYKKNYWEVPKFDEIAKTKPKLAIALFNLGVNAGVGTAQQIYDKDDSYKDIIRKTREYYKEIIRKNPNQKTFKEGWENRTKKLEDFLEKLQYKD